MKAVIVVPVHREYPTHEDLISISHCVRLFKGRRITVLAPNQLDMWLYGNLFDNCEVIRVPNEKMSSLRAYNETLMSGFVHGLFKDCSHMLLHEPDAIVFRDELDEWCEKDIDYIGAPWFEGWASAGPTSPIVGVGNSGLSLHRLEVWRRMPDMVFAKAKEYERNCDLFWSYELPKLAPFFRIATAEDALKFSWEALPRRCAEMAGIAVPFGMHKWFEHDREFAESLMMKHGVSLQVDL